MVWFLLRCSGINSTNERGYLCHALRECSCKKSQPASPAERLAQYRAFVREKGGVDLPESPARDLSSLDRFRYRTRYFSESAVIGTKCFVNKCYQRFRKHSPQGRQREATAIEGLPGIYAMK